MFSINRLVPRQATDAGFRQTTRIFPFIALFADTRHGLNLITIAPYFVVLLLESYLKCQSNEWRLSSPCQIE